MRRARIVDEFWNEAFGGDHHPAAYLYCRETVLHKAGFHARAFVPGLGEDAATGSAAAAFAAIINLFDAPPEGTYTVIIEQGIQMGRPGGFRRIRSARPPFAHGADRRFRGDGG